MKQQVEYAVRTVSRLIFTSQVKGIFQEGKLKKIAVCTDLTERKQVEQGLRSWPRKGKKELVDLGKTGFISLTVSHESRTPPSAIISSPTELLEHHSQRWSDEEKKREILGRITFRAGKPTSRIEDILDLQPG